MGYNHYRLQITLRLALTFAFLSLFVLSAFFTRLIFIPFFLLLCSGGMIWHLFTFIDKINRHYITFLQSILQSDFNRIYRFDELGGSFKDLNDLFEKVRNEVQQIKFQRDEQIYYLNTVLEKISVGILAYDLGGKIYLMNKSAQSIFQTNSAYHLDDLALSQPDLHQSIIELNNETKVTYSSKNPNAERAYTLQANILQFKHKTLRLITMQDIRSEMAENEVDAWQKLIRVLTHEIMNSITPITSLASTVTALIRDMDPPCDSDIRNAIETIQKRSTGLLAFVDSFRNLVKIPEPAIRSFSIKSLFDRVSCLVEKSLHDEHILWVVSADPDDFCLLSDEALLEQALINLINNAKEVLKGRNNGRICLSACQSDNGNVVISVIDNGPGIPPENFDRIFIPFFTTRKNGNGIGLSLVKQIMMKLKGHVSVHSEMNKETRFELLITK